MTNAAALFARWRVRLGYILAVFVLWFARPTPEYVTIGGTIGLVGLWLRAYAAGYLHKQEKLTVTGPYAHTRNPLYLGSAILALGAGVWGTTAQRFRRTPRPFRYSCRGSLR